MSLQLGALGRHALEPKDRNSQEVDPSPFIETTRVELALPGHDERQRDLLRVLAGDDVPFDEEGHYVESPGRPKRPEPGQEPVEPKIKKIASRQRKKKEANKENETASSSNKSGKKARGAIEPMDLDDLPKIRKPRKKHEAKLEPDKPAIDPRKAVELFSKQADKLDEVLGPMATEDGFKVDMEELRTGEIGLPADLAKSFLTEMERLKELSWCNVVNEQDMMKVQSDMAALIPVLKDLFGTLGTMDLKKFAEGSGEAKERKPGRKKPKKSSSKIADPDENIDVPELTDEQLETCLRSCVTGLDLAAGYLSLVTMHGASNKLFVDEVNEAVVKFIKVFVRGACVSIYEDDSKQSSTRVLRDVIESHAFENSIAQSVGKVLMRLHHYVCLVKLQDILLHQVVGFCLDTLFFGDFVKSIVNPSVDILVSVFSRYGHVQDSIIQELLSSVPRIPTKSRARRWKTPSGGGDTSLQVFTQLLLRLTMCTCLPLKNNPGFETITLKNVYQSKQHCNVSLRQITAGLLQRCVINAEKDSDARLALEQLITEILSVVSNPHWPVAVDFISDFYFKLFRLLDPAYKSMHLEHHAKTYGAGLIGLIGSILSRETSKSKKSIISLDPEAIRNVDASAQSDLKKLRKMAARLLKSATDTSADLWDLKKDVGGAQISQQVDDIVLKTLAVTCINAENQGRTLLPMGEKGERLNYPLDRAIFGADHSVYARTFALASWAEDRRLGRLKKLQREKKAAEEEDAMLEDDQVMADPALQEEKNQALIAKAELEDDQYEQFFVKQWSAPLHQHANAHAITSKHFLYRVYRQLAVEMLAKARDAAFCSLTILGNLKEATIRRTAIRGLADMVGADHSMINYPRIDGLLRVRLLDESANVRGTSLSILGKIILAEKDDGPADNAAPEQAAPQNDADMDVNVNLGQAKLDVLKRFYEHVMGRIADASTLVRRTACQILCALLINDPDHPDTLKICSQMLIRIEDSPMLKTKILSTFESIYFQHGVPTPAKAVQLAFLVTESEKVGLGSAKLLKEILTRFKNQLQLKNEKLGGAQFDVAAEYEKRLRDLTHVLYQSVEDDDQNDRHARRTSIMKTLVGLSEIEPSSLVEHVKGLCTFLALDGPPNQSREDVEMAEHVLKMMLNVIPHLQCQMRSLGAKWIRELHFELQQLIAKQGAQIMMLATRSLCLVVRHLTHDTDHILAHINMGMSSLIKFVTQMQQNPSQLDDMSDELFFNTRRFVFIICNIMSVLDLDAMMSEHDPAPYVNGFPKNPAALPTFNFRKLHFKTESEVPYIANTVAKVICALYSLDNHRLQQVLIQPLGYFLSNHRQFIKSQEVLAIFRSSMASKSYTIRSSALTMLKELLEFFEKSAQTESIADKKDGEAQEKKGPSASDSAQPLAVNLDLALESLLDGTLSLDAPEIENPVLYRKRDLGFRKTSLQVIASLNQQGLINPTKILPTIFTLMFYDDRGMQDLGTKMLKDMVEMRPQQLLNRFDDCVHRAFSLFLDLHSKYSYPGFVFPQEVFAPICELYAERFRKQKAPREKFLMSLLRQIGTTIHRHKFALAFPHLMTSEVNGELANIDEDEPVNSHRRFHVPGCGELPALHYYRLMYVQFIACILSSLPLVYESEALFVVYHCNRFLSLEADSLVARFESGEDLGFDKQTVLPTPKKSKTDEDIEMETPKSQASDIFETLESAQEVDVFATCVSSMIYRTLKAVFKCEYKLTDERCEIYTPSESKQEKSKYGVFNNAESGQGEDGGNQSSGPTCIFPYNSYSQLASRLVERHENQTHLIEDLRTLISEDPMDMNQSKYHTMMAKLEAGEAKKAKKGQRGRKRKADGEPTIDALDAASDLAAAAAMNGELTVPGDSASPAPSKAKAKAKSAGKKKKAVDSDEDDADPSDDEMEEEEDEVDSDEEEDEDEDEFDSDDSD